MADIKFGWNVPTFSPTYITGEEHFRQIITVLGEVHDAFDSAWVYDHFHSPKFMDAEDYPRLEAWTTMTYLSHAFPNLYFGNIVIGQSYRNPALLAKMGATFQVMTGDKLILGIGAGWMESEYHAYGYEFPKASVRIAQLEEAVQIIRLMWTEKRATFEGEYYQVKGALCEPKPSTIPPIMIGGNGEKLTLRVVAKHADMWNGLSLSADEMEHKLNVLRSYCDEYGTDYDEIIKSYMGIVAIAETEDEARRIGEASSRRNMLNFVGTPQQIIQQMQAYINIGFTYFMLDFVDFPDSAGARLFADEVMPAFQ